MTRGPTRSDRLLHLVRLEADGLCGWQVRLPLWHPLSRGEVPYTQLFSDSRHGGQAGALQAARTRRDELFAEAGLPLKRGGRKCNTRNTTGLVGVTLAFLPRRRVEAAFQWTAQWMEEGTRRLRKRCFSVATYGFQLALDQAIQVREEMTGLTFDEEQRELAESLLEHVQHYVRTGKRLPLLPLAQNRSEPANART